MDKEFGYRTQKNMYFLCILNEDVLKVLNENRFYDRIYLLFYVIKGDIYDRKTETD